MYILILWLVTVILSFGVELANEFKMFKDAADAGYKLNVKKLSKIGKQTNSNRIKTSFLTILIPIFNIIKVLDNTFKYSNKRQTLLEQLRGTDAFEQMTEVEEEEYSKRPTGLNAFKVYVKSEVRKEEERMLSELAKELKSKCFEFELRSLAKNTEDGPIDSQNNIFDSINTNFQRKTINQTNQEINSNSKKKKLEDLKKEILTMQEEQADIEPTQMQKKK